MHRTTRTVAVVSLSLALGLMIALTSAGAINLGGVLKGAGVVVLVEKFGDQIDSAINKLTVNKNLASDAATKVVPILSLGSGGYIGAAQVSGPAEDVEKVKAVAQIEGNFSGRKFRLRALVPVGSTDTKNLTRISGVGVSAIIDIKL